MTSTKRTIHITVILSDGDNGLGPTTDAVTVGAVGEATGLTETIVVTAPASILTDSTITSALDASSSTSSNVGVEPLTDSTATIALDASSSTSSNVGVESLTDSTVTTALDASSSTSSNVGVEPSSAAPVVTPISSGSNISTAVIVGATTGTLGFVILVAIGICCIRRKWPHALPHLRRPRHLGDKPQGASGLNGERHGVNAPPNGEPSRDTREAGVFSSGAVDVARHGGSSFDNDVASNGRLPEVENNPRRQRVKQRLPHLQEPIVESSEGPTLSHPGGEFTDPSLSSQEMSSLLQEMDSVRERMEQVLRRQQQSVDRNSNLATFAPSEVSDGNRAEPPAYSEVWRG